MRNKKTFILLYLVVAVLLLGVAYASIQNINLKITGSAGATPDQANFKVAFTGEPTFTGKGTADLAITGDLTATMNVSGLDGVGDTFTATYAVANTSTDITAYLRSEVTNVNTKYFEVTSSLEKEVLEPQTGITNLNVTVKCIRTPITGDEKDTITVEVIASPTPIEDGDEEGGEDIGGGIIGGDTGETVTDLELMKRYVLGAEKTGRSILEIANLDMSTYQVTSFIDDPASITDASTTVTIVVNVYTDDSGAGIAQVKYNNTIYKIVVNGTTFVTESVEVLDIGGREGQTVAYDSNNDGVKEDWIILTDRDGLVEIVSAAPMGSLRLGYDDPEIKGNLVKYLDLNKDGIPDDLDGDGTIEEGGADLDKDGITEVDYQDIAIASYNNAITTINNYCKSLVTATNNGGVRSVGASSDTSGNYSSTNFNSWFKNSETVKVKAGDEKYKTDWEKMRALGIAATGTEYWLASRNVYEYSSRVAFYVRYVYAGGGWGSVVLWNVNSGGDVSNGGASLSVRPVVINPSGI